ncbi:MAG: hypothetical protein KDD53_06215 [Bdellovibrionales bacterium]|nr:hypothetical protein [Bdellovibrionales bacterium]
MHIRTSDLSGKRIVSTFSSDCNYKVFDQEEWWSDAWNPLDYAREYQLNKTFTEQFSALLEEVPHPALYTSNVENSYYTNFTLNLKNCYLLFGGGDSEECLYGRFIVSSRDVVDSLNLYSCELCYEGVASENCYSCLYFTNCRQCRDCYFVEDCESCENCIFCYGLYRKKYAIFNQEVGKEAYESFVSNLFPLTNGKISELLEKFSDFKSKLPRRSAHLYSSESCSGDMIHNSKNCHYSFDVRNSEDCFGISFMPNTYYSLDCTYAAPHGLDHCYEACSSSGSSNSAFIFLCWNCDAAFYSIECHQCQDIFGCVGLRNKRFCIFNKQYSESEYRQLTREISRSMRRSGEWGEFFSPSISYFGYNDTVAHEYFPMTRKEVHQLGWNWNFSIDDYQPNLKAAQISASSAEGENGNTERILHCAESGRAYKLMPLELSFYEKMSIPVPQYCPEVRHTKRLLRRNPLRLWKRRCDISGEEILSTFAPGRSEIVISEREFLNANR